MTDPLSRGARPRDCPRNGLEEGRIWGLQRAPAGDGRRSSTGACVCCSPTRATVAENLNLRPIIITKIRFKMDDGEPVTDGSTIMRADSIKSNSVLHLADILSQHLLLHPFVSLRRTCQVNRKCSPAICVQPFSLVPFLYHQQRKQGLSAWYKGLSSELLAKGITLGAETGLANYTDWPREVCYKRFLDDSLKVLALRGISVAIGTSFLCAAVKETIQSVIVVRDTPSFVDCLKDGFLRLIHLRSIPSARMLPIWLLVVPTVLYHVSHSAIWHTTMKLLETIRGSSLFKFSSSSTKSKRRIRQRTRLEHSIIDESSWQQDELTYDATEISFDADIIEKDSERISNSILASLVADVALLPVETVLNSLYIQGTRTIIDNVDETTVVLPVLTNYDGFNDCYQSILKFEGHFGLYKGLGAIVLQYSVHFLIFRSLYYLIRKLQPNERTTSPVLPRRAARPLRGYHTKFIQDNRHSTPSNPNEPKPPHLDSIILQDSSLSGTVREPSNIEFAHNSYPQN